MKFPKALKEAIEEFDAAAQQHGWDQDQGSHSGAVKSKAEYEKTKAKMCEEINKMRRNDRRRP